MTDAKTPKRAYWAFVPVGFFSLMFLVWGTVIAKAVGDPTFAVEDDYYSKAVAWDEKMAQDERNTALGWQLDVRLVPEPSGIALGVKVDDAAGTPVTGATVRVEAFHNARSGNRTRSTLVEGEAGEYRAELPAGRPGLWEVRVEVTRGSERFTRIVREDLRAGASG